MRDIDDVIEKGAAEHPDIQCAHISAWGIAAPLKIRENPATPLKGTRSRECSDASEN
jgi:hypothetical protein